MMLPNASDFNCFFTMGVASTGGRGTSIANATIADDFLRISAALRGDASRSHLIRDTRAEAQIPCKVPWSKDDQKD